MLDLNKHTTQTATTAGDDQVWKVLVYDRAGQDIISPLLSVKELRDAGVTLHLLLHSDRQTIPEVPAVYFVSPSEDNIQRIAQDFQDGLYDTYYLNFISPISRARMEDLAQAALRWGCVANIAKVYDQYVNFISLEDDLFVLKQQGGEALNYYAINRGDVQDTEMNTIMDTIVDSLFSVCVSLGTIPVIRCQKGNAAEMVAEKLDKKLRETLRDARNSPFSSDAQGGTFHLQFQRPLLVILDRNIDLATPLHHTWTYQALCHDVLDLSLNRVALTEAGHKRKLYDLCAKTDKFWANHKGSPFPNVAQAVQEELDRYRASEGEVKQLKAAMGLEGAESDEAISMLSDNTAKLTSAVTSLPELLERKRLIDLHTNVATAILEKIKERKLDIYFEIEEKIFSKGAVEQRGLVELLSEPEGSQEDKLREKDPTRERRKVIEAATFRNTKMAAAPSDYSGEVTRVVDSLMEQRGDLDSQYRYFDPKLLRLPKDDPSSVPSGKSRLPFTDAICFVIGGGNYIEFQNLQDYAHPSSSSMVGPAVSSPSQKRVLYGCTNLVNASEFLRELEELGKEIKSFRLIRDGNMKGLRCLPRPVHLRDRERDKEEEQREDRTEKDEKPVLLNRRHWAWFHTEVVLYRLMLPRETTKTRPEVSPEFVYWHEQTFAVVQEASNGTVILCRLIEAIRPHEITAERRRLADLKYLIVKLTFSQMMDLMNRCRILNEEFIQPEEKVDEVILEYYPILDIDSDELLPELPPPMAERKEERRNARSLMYSLTRGNVIPGTKWCGSGDVAEQYFDLGEDAMLDS
ncbi:unnamed protein product [Cyprideis torosa]|uniref:Phospholipase A2-like central domain-containing protein n=1 Tax=Cyprideis torosa TaxID=163714 RepID=A0A7R8W971_9CRUS|nr:unnamed protein product [Cyprideis torosa]CAG0889430.1 unnamed protein product [Cyprideis torosa]